MKFKKSMLILILAVFLISIAGVCASDVNDTAMASHDDTAMESTDENLITVEDSEPALSTEENGEIVSDCADEEIVSAENDLDELSANPGTYSGLSSEIGTGGNVVLTHDYYTYDNGTTITISTSNSVIDGNGAIIDMNGSNILAFKVTGSGVTIKNLTIKNANVTEDNDGAAIYFEKAGTIENCNFINNYAGDAGAVYFNKANSKVINCNFTGNKAAFSGGAVCFKESGTVENCNFDNNTCIDPFLGSGGAICFNGTGNAINCNFVNNAAKGVFSWAGAISFIKNGNAINCTFTNNKANSAGGAVEISGNVKLENCSFDKNSAKDGGAVEVTGAASIINCNFTDNKVLNEIQGYGGAVYWNTSAGNIKNCIFDKNSAFRGGAVYFEKDGEVTDCKFNDNLAGDGGAVWFTEKGTVENSIFVKNEAWNEYGGGICFYTTGKIRNCSFTDSKADKQGGAVYWNGAGTVENCNFTNNTAQDAGAIFFSEDSTVENCIFVKNSATDQRPDRYFGGAIVFYKNGEVTDSSFTENTATEGGAILFKGNGKAINCDFTSNSAKFGGAIDFESRATVENCNFNGNIASSNGSAIWVNRAGGAVSSSVFVNNRANSGVIFFMNNDSASDLTINDNIFLNNKGVAIYFAKNDSVSNADYNWFGNNATNCDIEPVNTNVKIGTWLFLNATANPDPIHLLGSSDIIFKLYAYTPSEVSEYDNSRLNPVSLTLTPTNGRVNATKTDLGKPVQYTPEGTGIDKLTATIENAAHTITLKIADGTTFSDLNFVINGNDNDTIVLDRDYTYNSIFDYNLNEGIVINRPLRIVGNGHTLNAAGLARIFSIQASNVVIENITFVNGKTDRHGGAIFWSGNNANISDCIFVNNSADQQGAAINLDGDDSVVSNCIFVNNNAYSGGAVYWSGDNGSVSGCSFVNNSASDGGALTFMGYKGSVSGCSFVNNSARLDGGAIYLDESDEGIVFNCSFENNYADRQGGAISWRYTKDGVVFDCSFVDNSASDGGAVYWSGDDGNVSGSIFVNNRANYGIVYFDNSLYGHLSVNDNIFLNNDGVAIYFVDSDSTSNVDYNWFGNNATNYNIAPTTQNVELGTWLFLNATAYPASISVSESSDILFKLYSYGASGVSDYDDSKLPVVNLTVTANNGEVDESIIALGDSVEFTPNGAGDASVTAAIENAEYTVVLDVAKAGSVLSGDDLVMDYRDGSAWAVALNDEDGNGIAGKVVKIGININGLDKVYSFVTDVNGVAGLPINLISGTYAVNATFEGDGDYEASFTNATVTVNRAVAVLTGGNLEMTYKDGSSWVVALSDADGDAIAGVKVAIGVAGKVYNIKTDDEGNAVLPVNLPSGTYAVNASFADSRYEAELISATIVVDKALPVLSAEDLVMNYKDGSAWSVTLTDADGNLMANTYVKLTVAGKTYTHKTGSDGVVSLPINLAVGNYTVSASFDGSSNLGAVEINRTVVVNPPVYDLVAEDVNMTYQDGTSYNVQIADAQGNPVAQAGVVIKVTINGKSYDRKTNAEGIASLPINLRPGSYEITAEYNGKQITNTITVNKA